MSWEPDPDLGEWYSPGTSDTAVCVQRCRIVGASYNYRVVLRCGLASTETEVAYSRGERAAIGAPYWATRKTLDALANVT